MHTDIYRHRTGEESRDGRPGRRGRPSPVGVKGMSGYRSRAILLLLLCVLPANGCATMSHGRSQPVIVRSEPPGARILVGGEARGVTPDFVLLSRRGGVITLEKDGFLPAEIEVPRSMAEMLLGDVALGVLWMVTGLPRLFGLARTAPFVLAPTVGLDLATGAAWELAEEVCATLEPGAVDAKQASVHAAAGAAGPPSARAADDVGRAPACLVSR